MAKKLNVSVGTLQKSLKWLEKMGIFEVVHGSGNYIRENNLDGSVYAMFRLELLEGGGLPRADVMSVSLEPKPEDFPTFGTSAKGSRVRRMRYLNETIIAVEEIRLDHDVGILKQSELSDSLYHYYQSKLNLRISRAEDYVTIGPVPFWVPEAFPLVSGILTSYVERLSWAEAAVPVEYSRTWFDTTRARYVQRLK